MNIYRSPTNFLLTLSKFEEIDFLLSGNHRKNTGFWGDFMGNRSLLTRSISFNIKSKKPRQSLRNVFKHFFFFLLQDKVSFFMELIRFIIKKHFNTYPKPFLWSRFFGTFFEKREFCLLAASKRMTFLTISNEKTFSRTQV